MINYWWFNQFSQPGFEERNIVVSISRHILEFWGATYSTFGDKIAPSSALPMHLLDFSYVVPFQNQGAESQG